MPQAVHFGEGDTVPKRLTGALAAGTVIAASAVAKQRVYVTGMSTVTFRYKAASKTGTITANIHPMLANAMPDESVGSRAVTGLPSAVVADPTTEQIISYTTKGEQYVEFELGVSAGGSDTVTLAYVDVFVTPLNT